MTATFTLISCIQGYYVYKDPVVGEMLNCEREDRNPQDPYTVGVKKVGTYNWPCIYHVSSRASAHYFNE